MKTILVIEDEPTVRDNIQQLLEIEGFCVVSADNGELGVKLAQQHQPSLIVCDVAMPKLDGYAVLQAIRQDAATCLIPFIFLTAKADRVDLRQGMELGADDYLTKPFTRAELLQAIATRLTKQNAVTQIQEKLQQLQLFGDEHLNAVVHDLRTPLTNMKLALDIMQMAPAAGQQQLYLDILKTECDRELTLVNDLLNLHQAGKTGMTTTLSAVDLHQWFPVFLEPFSLRSDRREQRLSFELAADLPLLYTDRTLIERALAELINNACKYTPPQGEIQISVHSASHVSAVALDEVPTIVFSIRNSVEIPAIELPRIFDKFYRLSNRTDRQEGTGMGLTTVQKLVEEMQGEIEVSSQNGWTTFTVQLPTQQYCKVCA